ncbi:MAG: GDYXXLXY domain-containing protein [Leptospirales bacterium]|nr:GDYXXLXY domain-containing protein [Leptospirales bacterium]
MKPYQKILFPIIVAAQLFVLVFMIAKQELLLANGAKVLLKCEPIDPRSLFSGDYVILNYEISRIGGDITSKSNIRDLYNFEGKDIYVALRLKPNDMHYHVAAISDNLNELKQNHSIIIRGRVEETIIKEIEWTGGEELQLRVKYGVESYFVPQGEGKKIENRLSSVSIEVSISDNGDSAISKLFIENQEVRFY